MASASDVPGRFDLVINGQGYMLLQSLEPSIPWRTHRAVYTSSPTFVVRQNVGSAYGDNAQDFFLTLSQKDWSLGEAQRYFRTDDPDRVRRYWTGSSIDVSSIPGQVVLRPDVVTQTFAEAVDAVTESNQFAWIHAAGATSLHHCTAAAGSVVNHGAHGLGSIPANWGLVTDSNNLYLSNSTANIIRKWDGSTFTTFSSVSGSDSMAYLNNTLYGYHNGSASLLRFDTSGNPTTLYTWKDASGAALTNGNINSARIRAAGSKLHILRTWGVRQRSELWQYDGNATNQIAETPAGFVATDVDVGMGVTYISGFYQRSSDFLPAIFYVVNGTIGELWRANVSGFAFAWGPPISVFNTGLVFADLTTSKLMQYDAATGGVSTIGKFTATVSQPLLAAGRTFFLLTGNQTNAYSFPKINIVSSGSLATSLFDFDNTLTKNFRGIKADFTSATDGDGGSVDLAYQVGSVDGSYTTLQTGAVSGTEYNPSVSGTSLSVQVTLNKGTSSNGPILKRIYVRAAPVLQSFKQREYILDLSGIGFGFDTVHLADGTPHPLSGFKQVQNLQTMITTTTPFSVTDAFGTFTAMPEPAQCEIMHVREGWDGPNEPGAFIGRIFLREV
ncbi:MAG: hypothetical protein ACYC9L_05475 [Sulfuricaulis sp.]